ncbi:MAG: ABC transporter permease subunit [Mesorhizobium sp.]|uniref:ABC transporter permease n=1 Tax=unclassified Mesorhizobium TaxID=325217 RepID=UPI000F75B6EF|nr:MULTISPECIES: ABC transporter permease [unclassified Mesorhizobium]AZO74373.1 ABC transporter permease [Mesorhizobium sp. M1D.F.Ca.ET.043.01.1.1]RWA96753.1 MAG: ABC transporter permease subunit [Mesorhizobium sp.]RWE17761.1 MAG: ABC transporter permease subunit [Mesorhizobium sp.]TJW90882.1 MAG: ABC transporter permease subunit [Mesorhizobium sp.]
MSVAADPALAADGRRERRFFLSLSLPALFIVGLAAILPLLWIVRQSFLTTAGQYSVGNYEKVLSSGLTWSALATTLELSLGTLVVCIILGIPLALALASARPRVANVLMAFVMLPLWTSILVRTYGWLVLLRRDGLINAALTGSGLTAEPLPLVYNFTGTLIGMVHYMLPLFLLPVYAAMRDIDTNLIRAAASMGATLGQVIRTVILPLSAGGILSGSIIVFIYTIGFFITPAVLGGGKVNPLSIRIERTLSTFQDWGSASVLGILLLVLMALIAVMFLTARRLMAHNKMGAAHA